MHDGFKALETGRIGQKDGCQLLSINSLRGRGAGKRRLNRRHGGAAIKLVNLGVGLPIPMEPVRPSLIIRRPF